MVRFSGTTEQFAEKCISKLGSCAGAKAQVHEMCGLDGATEVAPLREASCAAFFSKL
jgi:hypothetical protein